MERGMIEIFDTELQSFSDDYRFGNRFLFWGARVFTVMFCLFPMQEIATGFRMLPVVLLYMSIATAVTFMNSYTGIKEDGQNVTLYQKLRYLPMSWEEYCKSRRRYLWRTTWKTVIICMAAQLLMCLIAKEYQFGIWNALYILICTGVIPWIIAIINLHRKKK